jgi:N-methylhydantoinase A/oxoprolinase/acetone carboxylase beta subunit
MTVATNALLQGAGARTAFVATEGFTDLIALGRQARPELYRLCASGPTPLSPPERRLGAHERMTPDGPLTELTEDAIDDLIGRLREAEPEAVAVALLHAYRHPEHERRIGDAIAEAFPGVQVSLSHEVVGTFREYERAATTEVDAALSPLLAGYLRGLVQRCDELSLPEPTIMQSNGGLIELEAAAGHASWTVLSGPAGGAAGAAYVARASGVPDALCFDMGGTSCDVCVVDDGAVQEQSSSTIAGRPLALPTVAVHTVGAGGLHAAAIASELGIGEIVCPRASGVLAALGLVVSPRRRDVQRSVLLGGAALTADAIARAADELAGRAREQLGAGGDEDVRLSATFELRYRGQAFELPVAGALHPDPHELRDAFEALHDERYGYHDPDQELELVTLRVSAEIPGVDVELAAGDDQPTPADGNGREDGSRSSPPSRDASDPPSTRTATLGGSEIQLRVFRGAPAAGTKLAGPAVVELPESTLLVPPRWAGKVDSNGTIHLHSDGNAGDGPD